MVDNLTPVLRSWNMSRIRSKNTRPEIIVRSLLHGMGYRFRLFNSKLPGNPDIILPRRKKIIFVNSCFFHRHPGCRKATTPKSNVQYWLTKFQKNMLRDEKVKNLLEIAGWKVFTIWECQIKDIDQLKETLKQYMNE